MSQPWPSVTLPYSIVCTRGASLLAASELCAFKMDCPKSQMGIGQPSMSGYVHRGRNRCRFSAAGPQSKIHTHKSAPIGADFAADLLWICCGKLTADLTPVNVPWKGLSEIRKTVLIFFPHSCPWAMSSSAASFGWDSAVIPDIAHGQEWHCFR